MKRADIKKVLKKFKFDIECLEESYINFLLRNPLGVCLPPALVIGRGDPESIEYELFNEIELYGLTQIEETNDFLRKTYRAIPPDNYLVIGSCTGADLLLNKTLKNKGVIYTLENGTLEVDVLSDSLLTFFASLAIDEEYVDESKTQERSVISRVLDDDNVELLKQHEYELDIFAVAPHGGATLLDSAIGNSAFAVADYLIARGVPLVHAPKTCFNLGVTSKGVKDDFKDTVNYLKKIGKWNYPEIRDVSQHGKFVGTDFWAPEGGERSVIARALDHDDVELLKQHEQEIDIFYKVSGREETVADWAVVRNAFNVADYLMSKGVQVVTAPRTCYNFGVRRKTGEINDEYVDMMNYLKKIGKWDYLGFLKKIGMSDCPDVVVKKKTGKRKK
ncbi:MAG: SMI1/KNR4 family protein [Kiritimatiellaceae bacterium]|nr:SMI1/KNR4 family protein [Kiritimatiellaceae bacterium]